MPAALPGPTRAAAAPYPHPTGAAQAPVPSVPHEKRMTLEIQTVPASEDVQRAAAWVGELRAALGEVIVGQENLVRGLLIGLLTGGHVLLEGVPGLAKTLAVSSLA